jgi:MoaA/NifB/PqqE/SkfB family radical SAM enzyme
MDIGFDQVSFLPADVSSHAFNRQTAWAEPKQHEILVHERELSELQEVIYSVITDNKACFESRFIAESALKIQNIYHYYAAFYGINPFPYKKCNAPWVSAVIEADGTVRPCFFHDTNGNIHHDELRDVLNSTSAVKFRQGLNTRTNPTCVKCVCSLNLSPFAKLD